MNKRLTRYRRWLNARFVAIVEVIGYLLSAVVGVAAVYSMIAQVEVLARVTGPIAPISALVASDKQAVLIEYLAASGNEVKAGDAVCRVATSPEDRARVLAQRHYRAAVAALEAVPSSSSVAEQARSLLTALPAPEAPETLTAAVSGLLKTLPDPSRDEAAAAGSPFALVYDLGTLELAGPLEPANSERVAVGQTARVTLPNYPVAIEGAVVSVREGEVPAEPPKSVTLRFQNTPEEVRKTLRDILSTSDVFPPIPIRADIVVGHQSLFRYMFGKKS